MPGLRMVTVPVEEYYKRRITRKEVEPVAIGAFDALVDGSVPLLATNETNGGTEESPASETLTITAPTYDLALEEFYQVFLDNHWERLAPGAAHEGAGAVDALRDGAVLPRK